jgi:hypothetical protein
MAKVAPAVTLSDPDRAQLQQWVHAHFTPQQVALRSRILLLAADGKENLEIAAALKVHRHTPALWRQRYIHEGLDAVWEIQSVKGSVQHNHTFACRPGLERAPWQSLARRHASNTLGRFIICLHQGHVETSVMHRGDRREAIPHQDLAQRRKGDRDKIKLARRL